MKVAYVMNQHPYLSCTFIRREILGLERQGITVLRFAIRYPEIELIDDADKQEVEQTRYILREGAAKLLFNFCLVAITAPMQFLNALQQAIRLGMRSNRGLLLHLVYLLEACTLLRWLKQNPVEQVHSHFATNSTTIAMLCHTLGGPAYSFTVHGPHEFDDVESLSLPEKIVQAAFVLTISSFSKSQLFRWCSYEHWSKIYEIHCGVDDTFLQGEYTPASQLNQFVCVGRLSEQKGHFILLEAAHQLVQDGLAFKIVLVGDGPFRSQLETLIADKGLTEYVEITGWATNQDVQKYMKQSQILVQPSFAEGLPVVIMEALALGRPVLTTYIAGIPELVKPGKTGWLVPAGSVSDLAEAMRSILDTPSQDLVEMGKHGMAAVSERHNAWTEASKLAVLFEQATRARG